MKKIILPAITAIAMLASANAAMANNKYRNDNVARESRTAERGQCMKFSDNSSSGNVIQKSGLNTPKGIYETAFMKSCETSTAANDRNAYYDGNTMRYNDSTTTVDSNGRVIRRNH